MPSKKRPSEIKPYKMNPAEVELVAALRSGKFKQGVRIQMSKKAKHQKRFNSRIKKSKKGHKVYTYPTLDCTTPGCADVVTVPGMRLCSACYSWWWRAGKRKPDAQFTYFKRVHRINERIQIFLAQQNPKRSIARRAA